MSSQQLVSLVRRPVLMVSIGLLVVMVLALLASHTQSIMLYIATPPMPLKIGQTKRPHASTLPSLHPSHLPQAPPMFTHTPESLLRDTTRFLRHREQLQNRIVQQVPFSEAEFANIILPLAHEENLQSAGFSIIAFYQFVSADAGLRDASRQAMKMIAGAEVRAQREDLFSLVSFVYEKQSGDMKLDPEERKLLASIHASLIRSGLGLSESPRHRFAQVSKRLSDISITFLTNLDDNAAGLWLKGDDLEGTPVEVLDRLKKCEDTTDEDRRWLTLDYPTFSSVQSYCANATTRLCVFLADENKGDANADLFTEAIVLRDEAARLLGYTSHAALRLRDRMAGTPQLVNGFLDDLHNGLIPGGLQDIERLKQLKQSGGEVWTDKFYLWDHRFYDTITRDRDHHIDRDSIAEYFTLDHTVEGMLGIFEDLFGLVFIKLDARHFHSSVVWHPDVQLYSVWNDDEEGSGFVGYLYLDLYPREGKYGRAANFNIRPGFLMETGTRQFPAAALVCNLGELAPGQSGPSGLSLLGHDEVVTLFHELGHGIHDLVSLTSFSRFHGTSTAQDFVEAPSQMLENWCWLPSQLMRLSRHYSYISPEHLAAWQSSHGDKRRRQPPETMPETLAQHIADSRRSGGTLSTLNLLHFSVFDMAVHNPTSHAEIVNLDIAALYNSLRHNITMLDGPEGVDDHWGHGHTNSAHLFSGYDAGYYGYLYSLVFSADMFDSVFKGDPMSKSAGRRYRHTVLEPGGSVDEMELLHKFLGRAPSMEAFYHALGLKL